VPHRAAQQIGPESAQVINATGRRAEQRGVAHQQRAGERVWSRLQHGVETDAAVLGEGVRADVEKLRSATDILPATITVSGHVYDVDTGLVTTVIPAAPMHGGAGTRAPESAESR
jgi:carbonic anhydrase